jgi:hypothetical protein
VTADGVVLRTHGNEPFVALLLSSKGKEDEESKECIIQDRLLSNTKTEHLTILSLLQSPVK